MILMRKAIASLLTLLALACTSTGTAPADDQARASVTIASIHPSAGDPVNGSSVLEAQIDYSITGFNAGSEYYLAPLFDSTEGPGNTFNEYERLTDGIKITASSGSLHLRYPIAREWRNPKLAKPVRVRFFVMVRTGAHKTRVIGTSEIVQFGSSNLA